MKVVIYLNLLLLLVAGCSDKAVEGNKLSKNNTAVETGDHYKVEALIELLEDQA